MCLSTIAFRLARGRGRSLLLCLACVVATAAPGRSLLAQIARLPNDSLSLPGSLPSGNYTTVDAFPGIAFSDPLAFATPPGEGGRLFVAEQTGRISLVRDPASPTRETFLDITDRVRATSIEEGLLGLAFHPSYHVAGSPGQGKLYVVYMATVSGQRSWRLSRFSAMPGNPNRADPDSEVHLITQSHLAGNHNGGDLHFGDDGYLYASIGDEGGANDQFGHGQRIDKGFFASVLRLDVDRRQGNLPPNPHPAIHPDAYLVPADNPFVGARQFNGLPVDPGEVRTEFWAAGLRNPWRMSFDRPTGRLFVADVGQLSREEINILSPATFASNGGVPNYGWSFREGLIAFTAGPGGTTPPPGFTAIDPIHDYPRSEGRSVTGGLLYRGPRYPELSGAYLFADYVLGRVWAMSDAGGPAQAVTQIASRTQIAAFGLDPSTADVLLARNNSNRLADDPVLRLVREPADGPEPPDVLSATGAFRDVASLAPEEGIVPYEINAPFWSDHAVKRRWFSLPDPASHMTWSRDGNWGFPAGQVWIKHFELDLDRDAPGTRRVRVETRFLVRTGDDVYGITYRWNEEQSEAFLVGEEGENADFTVIEGGTARTQNWRFPSRSDCRACHNPAAGWALGFDTRQLNRLVDYGEGATDQLAALASAGYFESTPPPSAELPAHAPPHDPAFPLEARARAYLASNCAACHQPGGTGMGAWSARPDLSLEESHLIGAPLVNNAGNPSLRTFVPGRPERSMILSRIATPRSGEGLLAPMPPLGSNEIDEAGLALLEEWMRSLRRPLSATEGLHLDRIALEWQGTEGAESYTVYRSEGDDFSGAEPIASIAAGEPDESDESVRHDDFGTEEGAVRRYWVASVIDGTAGTPEGPAMGWRAVAAPVSISASDATRSDRIEIEWGPVEGATYRLYRSSSSLFPDASLRVETGDLSHREEAEQSSALLAYRYWVTAVRHGTESAPTGPALGRRALIPAGPLEASTDVSPKGIALSWSASPDAGGYRILRHSSDDFGGASLVGSIGAGATSWFDTGAEAVRVHHYWVVATNARGEAAPSSSATGRRLPATRQPDLTIGRGPGRAFGEGLYQGAAGQTLALSAPRRRPMRAFFHLRNAGNVEDGFRLLAGGSGGAKLAVRYLRRRPAFADISRALLEGRHFFSPLPPGRVESGEIFVSPRRPARDRRAHRALIFVQAFSIGSPDRHDRIRLRATSRR
jgi:uncharacterized repeat protein (TIGR03806 family)